MISITTIYYYTTDKQGLLTDEACEVSVVRGKVVWRYRDTCEKPFGDNLQLGGWAWPQTSLFTVPLHAAALPLLAALTPLPFTWDEQPSPQPKNSSGRGHFEFSISRSASGTKRRCSGLLWIGRCS